MFHLSCSSLNLTTFHGKVLFHFSSLNRGKIWWCLFQEHTCFALMHFSGKRNIEQIVSAPATPELRLTQQDWSILLLWFAIHQQNPQCCCAHLRLSLRLVPFHFCILLHFLQHRSINLCLLPGSEQRHVCGDEVKRGRCAVSVTRCTHPHRAFPARIATPLWNIPVLGLAGRTGWGQESTGSWCSPSQLPRGSGTADPCSPHKTFHDIKC